MPGFNADVPHKLGKQQATERLKGFLNKVGDRYKDQVSKMDGTWTDNVLNFTMTTYGISITGSMTVEEEVVKLAGNVPFAAMLFKGKIEQSFSSELEKALA